MFADWEHYWIILCLGDRSADDGDDNDGVDDAEKASYYPPQLMSVSYTPGLC